MSLQSQPFLLSVNAPKHTLSMPSQPASASQKVPMFLQKLYKIVSDESTNQSICWNDAGDSFLVYNPDRLAKLHLGDWFKHNNFSSFVRQLNMYGFHKIPHLQQGVLHNNDNGATGKSKVYNESWEFKHPLFQRGAEGALAAIERKKGGSKALFPESQPLYEIPQVAQPQLLPSPSPQQLQQLQPLDLGSLFTTLSALRQNQTSILSQLDELKRSNQGLWEEVLDGRKRWDGTKDTVGRIVKFLAGVFAGNMNTSNFNSTVINDMGFGNVSGVSELEEALAHGNSPSQDLSQTTPPGATHHGRRLMIEGVNSGPKSALEPVAENGRFMSLDASTPGPSSPSSHSGTEAEGESAVERPVGPTPAAETSVPPVVPPSTLPPFHSSYLNSTHATPPSPESSDNMATSYQPVDSRLLTNQLSPGDLQTLLALFSQPLSTEDHRQSQQTQPPPDGMVGGELARYSPQLPSWNNADFDWSSLIATPPISPGPSLVADAGSNSTKSTIPPTPIGDDVLAKLTNETMAVEQGLGDFVNQLGMHLQSDPTAESLAGLSRAPVDQDALKELLSTLDTSQDFNASPMETPPHADDPPASTATVDTDAKPVEYKPLPRTSGRKRKSDVALEECIQPLPKPTTGKSKVKKRRI